MVSERRIGLDDLKTYFKYLDALRESGATNMFGAGPYLEQEFGLTPNEAASILGGMDGFL